MNSKDGLTLRKRVETQIKRSINTNITWKESSRDGEQSFGGLDQIYSDKSKTSPKSASQTFCSLHVSLLDFKETRKRNSINVLRVCNTVLSDCIRKCLDECVTSGNPLIQNFLKGGRLHTLHESVKFALSALTSLAYTGFSACNGDSMYLICHAVPVSYVPYIASIKDMISVKDVVNTVRPFPKWLVPKKALWNFSKVQEEEAMNVYLYHLEQTVMKTWYDKEQDYNLFTHKCSLMFSQFPFVVPDASDKLYICFCSKQCMFCINGSQNVRRML